MKRRVLVNREPVPAAIREHRVYGVHPVTEWVRSRPGHLTCIHYEVARLVPLRPLLEAASAAGVRIEGVATETLARLAGTPRHQGVVASAEPFPYVELDDLLRRAPRWLVLADQIQDPQNLGALLRTAEAVGAGGVLLPRHGSVTVTPSVEAAAAGAAALVPVCLVTNTARTLRELKTRGFWTVGLLPRADANLYSAEIPQPTVVVVGGETGMRPLVAKQCDVSISIPMNGRIESLNASVAAAVVLYELWRRCQAPGEECR